MSLETLPVATCPRCHKAEPLCVCTGIEPIANRVFVLVLQHPQEQDRDLGTARLAALHFQNVAFKVGLSWPNLAKALGRPVADPKRWAVLYLGPATLPPEARERELAMLDRKGALDPAQDEALAALDGVVLLDGTWSQAKALWWRNAWMLKCQRVILGPARPSRYGQLRREPRRDGLSTIEAAGMLLAGLEKRPDIAETLNGSFERLLARYLEVQAEMPELAPKPKKKDYRRRKRA